LVSGAHLRASAGGNGARRRAPDKAPDAARVKMECYSTLSSERKSMPASGVRLHCHSGASALDIRLHFDIIRSMKTNGHAAAVGRLAALAQETRLALFRLLVEAGPAGLAAGVIGERLDVAAPTLSFHLKELTHAGLIRPVQQGRYVFYSADFDAMNALIAYLTENCCRMSCDPQCAVTCAPAVERPRAPARKRAPVNTRRRVS
jgi:DNA-binding transcriptional ArsR family regulator